MYLSEIHDAGAEGPRIAPYEAWSGPSSATKFTNMAKIDQAGAALAASKI